MCIMFFFFKQKTAYEVRISDWSSDVCSSDLSAGAADRPRRPAHRHAPSRVPRRGHLRPAAARGRGPGAAHDPRPALPHRALPGQRRGGHPGGRVMTTLTRSGRVLDVEVPDELIADRPPEAEGRRRDSVRMLVAHRSGGELEHSTAAQLPRFLDPGDVLVVNTSSTLPAAVRSYDGELVVHLSPPLGAARWVVEGRRPSIGRAP